MSNKVPAQFYRDIHRLPLDRFINITCEGNLEDLVISGTPTPEELKAAWGLIVEEYNLAITDGSPQGGRIAELYKSIATNAAKLHTVQTLVPVMYEYFTPQFAKRVNKALGTSLRFDPLKRDEFEKTLQRCLERAKGFKVKISFDEAKLKTLLAESDKKATAEKPTRKYFASLLVNLSDYAGYLIRESDITTGQFVERVKRYTDAITKAQAPKVKTLKNR